MPLGSNISLHYYDFNNPTYLDTTIQPTYKNIDSNVTIDGGAYYDTYSSHAPEELIPGATFDNLNMMVTTRIQNNSAIVSYLVEHNMQANASSSNYRVWPKYYGVNYNAITTLTADLNVTDSNIHVANAAALTAPNLSTVSPGIVYINGEKITFWTVDYNNNVLGQIRRAVDGTGSAFTHVSGSTLIDVNIPEIIPGGNLTHTYISRQAWLNSPPGAALAIVDEFGEQITANVAGSQISLSTLGNISGAVTDGSGLEGAMFGSTPSLQAAFLKKLIHSLS